MAGAEPKVQSSPVTRSPLEVGQLAPNRGLKETNDRAVEARRAASPPASPPASAEVVVVAEQQTPLPICNRLPQCVSFYKSGQRGRLRHRPATTPRRSYQWEVHGGFEWW